MVYFDSLTMILSFIAYLTLTLSYSSTTIYCFDPTNQCPSQLTILPHPNPTHPLHHILINPYQNQVYVFYETGQIWKIGMMADREEEIDSNVGDSWVNDSRNGRVWVSQNYRNSSHNIISNTQLTTIYSFTKVYSNQQQSHELSYTFTTQPLLIRDGTFVVIGSSKGNITIISLSSWKKVGVLLINSSNGVTGNSLRERRSRSRSNSSNSSNPNNNDNNQKPSVSPILSSKITLQAPISLTLNSSNTLISIHASYIIEWSLERLAAEAYWSIKGCYGVRGKIIIGEWGAKLMVNSIGEFVEKGNYSNSKTINSNSTYSLPVTCRLATSILPLSNQLVCIGGSSAVVDILNGAMERIVTLYTNTRKL